MHQLDIALLDTTYKGMPYGETVDLADIGDRGWNVLAGDMSLPLLTVDVAALDHNISTMADYCRLHNVLLAPHGKTTMSPQVFRRQLAAGAWAMTAATLGQVRLMWAVGIRRILLANQVAEPSA